MSAVTPTLRAILLDGNDKCRRLVISRIFRLYWIWLPLWAVGISTTYLVVNRKDVVIFPISAGVLAMCLAFLVFSRFDYARMLNRRYCKKFGLPIDERRFTSALTGAFVMGVLGLFVLPVGLPIALAVSKQSG